MRKGVNKVTIVGYLGLDPDVNHASNGAVVTVISVATSESWTNKNTGELMTDTQWHRIVFFGRLAEIAGEYLKKGSQVYIEGKLQTRKWKDKHENDIYRMEIIGSEMQLLGHNPQNLSTTPSKVADNSNNDEPNHAAPTVDDFDDEPF